MQRSCFAVREGSVNRLDDEHEFVANDPDEHEPALLVDEGTGPAPYPGAAQLAFGQPVHSQGVKGHPTDEHTTRHRLSATGPTRTGSYPSAR